MYGIEEYTAIGAGGISFLVLIWVVHFMMTKMYPVLDRIKEDSAVNCEVIKNNTDAIKEISRSNDNVASALQLLNSSFKQLERVLTIHDQRAEKMQENIVRIQEKTSNCVKK